MFMCSIEKGHKVSCSIDEMESQRIVPWEGVVRHHHHLCLVLTHLFQRNMEASKHMREGMRIGDLALFYHSSCKIPGAVGVVRVCSAAYADPTQFDPTSPYFDPRSKDAKADADGKSESADADADVGKKRARFMLVDFEFVRRFKRIVSLNEIRETKELAGMVLLKRMRLSVQPVEKEAFEMICEMGDTDKQE